MEPYLVWIVVGIALVVAELVSGTFYLLVLGVASFVAAAVAWGQGPFMLQILVAGGIAIAGVLWIRAHRRRNATPDMPSLDVGQRVTLDSWVNRNDRLARVVYRDALWDAHVEGDVGGEPGEVLFIRAVEGSTLRVSRQKPA
ncbi:MAG: NfeD family protein [Burkholderiales bacterium]|jgi:membrane protein implicated in regulation of membrane protease activity|nr:NfeD family protein [Burkholderiales bacterium]